MIKFKKPNTISLLLSAFSIMTMPLLEHLDLLDETARRSILITSVQVIMFLGTFINKYDNVQDPITTSHPVPEFKPEYPQTYLPHPYTNDQTDIETVAARTTNIQVPSLENS